MGKKSRLELLDVLARALMDTRPELKKMSLDEWLLEYQDELNGYEREFGAWILNQYDLVDIPNFHMDYIADIHKPFGHNFHEPYGRNYNFKADDERLKEHIKNWRPKK